MRRPTRARGFPMLSRPAALPRLIPRQLLIRSRARIAFRGPLPLAALVLLGALLPFSPARAEESFTQAAVLALHGDAAGAIREYESYVQAHSGDPLAPVAVYAAANLRADALGDPAGALAGYERLVRDYGTSPYVADAARRRGDCLAAMEKWNDAGQAYAEALVQAGRGGSAPTTGWVNDVSASAADCFRRGGEEAKAVAVYEEVLRQPLPAQIAATLLMRQGATCESIERPAEAARSYARVVRDYTYTDQFNEAVGKRELIDHHAALDWQPYLAYARASRDMQAGDYARALLRTDSVLAGEPSGGLKTAAEARKIVTEMLVQNDFATGRRRLATFAELHPEYRDQPNTQRFLQYTQDVIDAQAGVRADSTDAGAYRTLGILYVNGRMPALAVGPLEKAHALAPSDAGGTAYLGATYILVGRYDDADRVLQAFFADNPDDVNTMNRMGYALLGVGQAERAIRYFRMYAEKAPDDPNSHDSLGEGYLNAGRLAEAAAEYEKAVALDPSFSNSHFMLGQVYQQLGEPAKARAAYERFLERVPTGAQADQAQAALRELKAD